MDNSLSSFIYTNITNDSVLQEKYNNLLVDYANSLFCKTDLVFNADYQILLNYADLLSLSANQAHQNIAQQIVILVSHLFPENNEVELVKESVYKNVSNFASLDLLKKNQKLLNGQYDFLRELEVASHRIENKIPDSDGSFFDTQKSVMDNLNTNQYYSFSAPTSMGKTFVIMSFIRSKLKNNCNENFVIVVPTRALLSEIANNVISEFKDYLGIGCHKVITNTSSVNYNDKFIAILTPERLYYSLLKQPDIIFHYIFIDEAHKISDKDKRSVTYYKILEMLKGNYNSSIYFSSPVIPNPDIYLELTDFYTQSNNQSSGQAFSFSPVIQNKIYLDFKTKEYSIINNLIKKSTRCGSFNDYFSDRMSALVYLGTNKCNLIYVSSANKAIEYAIQLSRLLEKNKESQARSKTNSRLETVAKEIEQKIHKEYYLANLIRKGVAFHIGALPAEIRAQIERLLRNGDIKYCFCTSTLLEGVNVPVDNLFIFDNKKGRSAMSVIDAFNLIGRAGRVTLNEYGNVFMIIENSHTQNYFNNVLLKPLPKQDLLPQKALERKHKKYIVEILLQGKTNLLEAGEKYSDRGFSETTYEYATKCLNMLLYDLCNKKDSYIVRDFRKSDVLNPQNIIDIRNQFRDIVQADDDINVTAKQKESLYKAVVSSSINYPTTFDYQTCLRFLKNLSQIFQWSVYEKDTLGKGERLRYYTVILTQWMESKGLHEIVRGAINHYQQTGSSLVSYNPEYHLEAYNGSLKHKNQIINEAMKDIEQIVNYKLSMYFLRFSEAIIKIRGAQALQNDWYEYVEYGTNNNLVILLQKYGFMREQALLLLKPPFAQYIKCKDRCLVIEKGIFQVVSGDILAAIEIVRINYPEIFI